jgi:hypothetical protein
MKYSYRPMIGHGLLIIFMSMCLGIGLLISLVGGMELIPGQIIEFAIPGDAGAWARAHVGGMMNGMLIVISALTASYLSADAAFSKRLCWMLVGTGYANFVFYIAALLADNRALTFGDNHFGESNIAAILGLLPALVFVIVSLIAVWGLMRLAFKPAV